MDFIDLKRIHNAYRDEIDGAMRRVLEHGQFINGPEVAQLEAELCQFSGAQHGIGVASGTDALMMVLMALGIGPGDEVVTVPYTFFATAEVVALLGATPVFVDVDPQTYCMDVAKLEAAITPRTKAVMPVSLYGQMPDLEAFGAIAARHNLPVIEDAAQSFGATRHGRSSCGATAIACTSFFPAKPLGCYGDGGAIFCSDATLAATLRAIRVHGSSKRYHHDRLGITGRLDTLQAAILRAKLPHFAGECQRRAALGARYSRLLADVCVTPVIAAGNTHVYAQYAIRIANRDQIQAHIEASGVPTAVHYPVPLHLQPVFVGLGHRAGDFPVSEQTSREILCLPMHPFMTEAEQDQVVAAVRAAIASAAPVAGKA